MQPAPESLQQTQRWERNQLLPLPLPKTSHVRDIYKGGQKGGRWPRKLQNLRRRGGEHPVTSSDMQPSPPPVQKRLLSHFKNGIQPLHVKSGQDQWLMTTRRNLKEDRSGETALSPCCTIKKKKKPNFLPMEAKGWEGSPVCGLVDLRCRAIQKMLNNLPNLLHNLRLMTVKQPVSVLFSHNNTYFCE